MPVVPWEKPSRRPRLWTQSEIGNREIDYTSLHWQADQMSVDELRDSLKGATPPKGLDFALTGLWWDAKGDWPKAHESAQQDEGAAGAWVHAYLHRKEGDLSNAAYWYRRAGKAVCRTSFEEEWTAIAYELLRKQS